MCNTCRRCREHRPDAANVDSQLLAEFKRALNPDVNGDFLVERLILLLQLQLYVSLRAQ
jgi:hypothetical protein